MKRTKLWNMILTAVLILQLLAEGLTVAIILRLDMLPAKYCAVLIGVFAFLGLLTGLLMFLHRKGKQAGMARRIIACVLAVLVVCGCAMLCMVATDIYQTMHSVTTPNVSKVTRSIYIRADDPAQTLADAADYSFAAVENYDQESTLQAIEVIESELGKKISVTYFALVTQMVDALYSGQADAIILNSAYVVMLEDMDAYADFSQKTKLLKEVPIVGWTAPTETTQATEPAETVPKVDADVTNAPFILYISGSDTRSDYLPSSTRSDVNILAAVNPVTKQVLLLNTPRDYFVKNPAGGGVRDKLTHCGIYGVDCSIQALENLYGIQVDYHARINFTGFETLIDAIGGITVYSNVGFSSGDYYFSAGANELNGAQALMFARERYHLAGGDNDRGKNQMKVIQAVIQKMTSGTTLISNYAQILDSLQGMFETSLGMDDISKLVKMQLTDMASWNVQSYAVAGKGGNEVTYSWPGQKLYVMFVDEDHVAYASNLVERVLAGEILTAEDLKGK